MAFKQNETYGRKLSSLKRNYRNLNVLVFPFPLHLPVEDHLQVDAVTTSIDRLLDGVA